MGFSEVVRSCLKKNYAGFQGRAARSEYWWFLAFKLLALMAAVIAGIVLGTVLAIITKNKLMMAYGTVAGAGSVILAMTIPHLAVAARRLHDLNMSGLWLLLGLIPGVGGLLLLGFCLPGSHGSNRFGSDPLQATAEPHPPRQNRTFGA